MFSLLFPAVKGGINPVRIIPRELMNRRMASDMSMMHAAYGPKNIRLRRKKNSWRFRICNPSVRGWYSALDRISKSWPIRSKGVGKEKVVCEMVQDLWSQVLKLPTARAAGVIRLMLSAEMQ